MLSLVVQTLRSRHAKPVSCRCTLKDEKFLSHEITSTCPIAMSKPRIIQIPLLPTPKAGGIATLKQVADELIEARHLLTEYVNILLESVGAETIDK